MKICRSKVSFASLKSLSSWVKDMIYRIDFMRSWLRNGQPSSFALPVFFFPQGFMTGTISPPLWFYERESWREKVDTLFL
jgi:hypothetical protein